MFSIARVAELVAGEHLRSSSARIERAVHDSRLVEAGDLFVALPGTRVDGHRFLEAAFARGATAALISNLDGIPANARNLILVPDTLRALHMLAAAWRNTLRACFVGITGTNGKTTVKDLIAHLLQGTVPIHATPGNYNTEIGVPLALLSMPESARVGVFELGAERPGDITILGGLLQPDLAVLTSIGSGHLQELGTPADVAHEKWTLVSTLSESGVCYFNADAPYLIGMAEAAPVRCLPVRAGDAAFGFQIECSVPHLTIQMPSIPLRLTSQLIGSHNATNLALAAAVALELGLPAQAVEQRVCSFEPQTQRLRALRLPLGTLLDDSYNANPNSMAGALQVLAAYPPAEAERIFVFGDMLGLGEEAMRFHREAFDHARALGVQTIIPVGTLATTACRSLPGIDVLCLEREKIPSFLETRFAKTGKPLVVLVKGSRAMELERVVSGMHLANA